MPMFRFYRFTGILFFCAFLISGCGKNEFEDKVPESADTVLFVNGNALLQNRQFAAFLEKAQEDFSLPKTSFQSLKSVTGYLFYMDSSRNLFGSLVQTKDAQAQELYLLLKAQKGIREQFDGDVLYLEAEGLTVQLISPDFLICRKGKILKEKQHNSLMKQLHYENMISGVFRKPPVPQGQSAMYFAHIPGISGLQYMTLNIPSAPDRFKICIRGVFADKANASQFASSMLLLRNVMFAHLKSPAEACSVQVKEEQIEIVLDSILLDQARTEMQKKITAEMNRKSSVPQKQQEKTAK